VQAGHVWNTTISGSTFTLTVDSVNLISINGFSLKRVSATYTYYYAGLKSYPVTFTERYGSNGYLFDFKKNNTSDGYIFQNFLGYKDDTLGYVQFTSLPCDYSNLTAINDFIKTSENSFEMFPNPANEVLNVKYNMADRKWGLKIMNAVGQKVVELIPQFSEENITISTDKFSSGIYFVNILYEGKIVATKKLVIAH